MIYGNGSHAAIYIGNGLVISALNPRQGIRITRLHALTARFTTFIHTQHLARRRSVPSRRPRAPVAPTSPDRSYHPPGDCEDGRGEAGPGRVPAG